MISTVWQIALFLILLVLVVGCTRAELARGVVVLAAPKIASNIGGDFSHLFGNALWDESNRSLCTVALADKSEGEPSWDKLLPDHVAEAERRELTPASCSKLLRR